LWNELKAGYRNDFKRMVYGDFPPEEDVLETLKTIRERLQTVVWTIQIET
jgi:hypothetical protein